MAKKILNKTSLRIFSSLVEGKKLVNDYLVENRWYIKGEAGPVRCDVAESFTKKYANLLNKKYESGLTYLYTLTDAGFDVASEIIEANKKG